MRLGLILVLALSLPQEASASERRPVQRIGVVSRLGRLATWTLRRADTTPRAALPPKLGATLPAIIPRMPLGEVELALREHQGLREPSDSQLWTSGHDIASSLNWEGLANRVFGYAGSAHRERSEAVKAVFSSSLDEIERLIPELVSKRDERVYRAIQARIETMNGAVDSVMSIARGSALSLKAIDDVRIPALRAFASQKALAARKNVELNIDLPPLEMSASSNENSLESALGYLIREAIEETPEGGRIWIEMKPTTSMVAVTVRHQALTSTAARPESLLRLQAAKFKLSRSGASLVESRSAQGRVTRSFFLGRTAPGQATRARDERREPQGRIDEFIERVHDLRTPLAPILGYSQLLARNIHAPEKEELFLQTMDRNIRRLRLNIDSMATAGNSPALVDANEVFFQASHTQAHATEAKKLGIRLHLPSQPTLVRADPLALIRIMENLLSNAVKYTPEGGRISAGVEIDSPGFIRFYVKDTGIGMSPEDLRQALAGLYRTEKSQAMARGTGVGLYSVQQLLNKQGSRLQVRSQEGKGSEFFFVLPLAAR
ncbi:MAG: hypothetical protein HY549_07650 [Elusimicrobia bacterium]|nr:hypothetical protein [Elusimicrobiota bacterium]